MLEIKVCIGSSCHLKGSYNVINEFQHLIEENSLHDKIDIKATFCMKQCQKSGVAVEVNNEIFGVLPEAAEEFFNNVILPKV
ncbi:(2Fe-2S) ferredoxin domain-containing protein [Acetivibrio mesophilus]|uniref:(2Fe-2S) ferredoxin domain-containing protein n=1 Tax=Acetivibrio mesophilus TaxID=2487273 RepID=A0A4Q0I8M5_9FIRM|nr:(2Fe-2S) ferredoxin domain-containing protein [Acetivibrio mesophilus]ODM25711.1 NADH dehydrogenase [Clostridium sp. Bc-iso-3]RXE60295.1 (2Fe-2S) ferredoxin domain-containing protein [Acetivibrio mesophilus]HHV30419.1 (2Fe-2S) ferredoxin domain-containing protein [Clostridium sp.]